MKIESSYCVASGVPLGGIGTGSVELRADGRFYEWHIFNNGRWAWRREDREKEFMSPEDFFFAVRTKTTDNSVRVRLLQASKGYELGGDPYTFPWFRSVDKIEYNGEPPFIFIMYIDQDLPVDIELEAFSPFIPGDVKSSSIPIAFFKFRIRNKLNEELELSLLTGIKNPFSEIPAEAEIFVDEIKNGFALTIKGINIHKKHCMYRGSITLGFLGEGEYGYCLTAPYERRSLRYKWVEFRSSGTLKDKRKLIRIEDRVYSIAVCKKRLKPKEETNIIIFLAWFFPNHYDDLGYYLGHAYENYFDSSSRVVEYAISNFEYLYNYTKKFHDFLYSTSADYWLIDLIASQLTTMVKSTYYTKDGLFGVWEGYGCCGLNTTDVAFYGSIMVLQLFPELEKTWIEYHAKWQLKPDLSPYYEVFTLAIPENMALLKEELKKDPSIGMNLEKFKITIKKIIEKTGKDPTGRIMHYFVGSFNRPDTYDRPDMNPEYVLMVIRDVLWLGDKHLLESLWNVLKEATEVILRIHDLVNLKLLYHYTPAGYEAIRQSVAYQLGFTERFGRFLSYVSAGYTFYPISVQTFDAWSLMGITSFTGMLWLASLKALEKAAEIVGDNEYSERVREVFSEGRENLVKYLWNGEYLDLWYDPVSGKRDKGCSASQLDGQLYLTLLLDLGYILSKDKTLKALQSIFKYNFTEEEGLLNGVYPGKPRPAFVGDIPLPNDTGLKYTVGSQIDTPWTGIEFEVAAHMISEGMIKEALKILKSIHERYARYGEYWNHIECGGHYYRPMDSWLVLMSLEGLFYNGFEKRLRFIPKINERMFKGLLVITGNWGIIEQEVENNVHRIFISLEHGLLTLKSLELKKFNSISRVEVSINGEITEVSFKEEQDKVVIELDREVTVTKTIEVKIYYH